MILSVFLINNVCQIKFPPLLSIQYVFLQHQVVNVFRIDLLLLFDLRAPVHCTQWKRWAIPHLCVIYKEPNSRITKSYSKCRAYYTDLLIMMVCKTVTLICISALCPTVVKLGGLILLTNYRCFNHLQITGQWWISEPHLCMPIIADLLPELSHS